MRHVDAEPRRFLHEPPFETVHRTLGHIATPLGSHTVEEIDEGDGRVSPKALPQATMPSSEPDYKRYSFGPFLARSSRLRNSAAKASCAAREPRIQPIMTPITSTPGMKMKCADVISPIIRLRRSAASA
jgi:hypothetical protein